MSVQNTVLEVLANDTNTAIVRVYQLPASEALREAKATIQARYDAAHKANQETATASMMTAATGKKADMPAAIAAAMATQAQEDAKALIARDLGIADAIDQHTARTVKASEVGIAGVAQVQKTRFLQLVADLKIPQEKDSKTIKLTKCQVTAVIAQAGVEGWLKRPSTGPVATAFSLACYELKDCKGDPKKGINTAYSERVLARMIPALLLLSIDGVEGQNVSSLSTHIMSRLGSLPTEVAQARLDAVLSKYTAPTEAELKAAESEAKNGESSEPTSPSES